MKQLSKNDRMPINIYPINELGIMQLTRKKALRSLYEMVSSTCHVCNGSGRIKNADYVVNTILNQIISIFSNTIYNKVVVYAHKMIINRMDKITIPDKKIDYKIIDTTRLDYFNIEKFIE